MAPSARNGRSREPKDQECSMSNSGSVPDQPTEPQPREIGDDEYLSQYGSRQGGKPLFWSRPRPADTDGLSATIGRLTPAEARRPVRMVGAATSDDGVRFNEC